MFRRALTEGPQHITRHSAEGVIVISDEEYNRLKLKSQPKSIVQFFRQSPLVGLELDFEREKDLSRDVEL